jgi:hypothetical protein
MIRFKFVIPMAVLAAGAKELNEAGKYYQEHGNSPEGYVPAK